MGPLLLVSLATALAAAALSPGLTPSTTDWAVIGTGVAAKGKACTDTLLVGFGGWKAPADGVQHWVDSLAGQTARVATSEDTTQRLYAVAGPVSADYREREIDTDALAAELQRALATPECQQAALIAHSSGSYVAQSMLQQLANDPATLGKIAYINLDGDSGRGDLALTRDIAWQLGSVTAVAARTGALESPNAEEMRTLAATRPNARFLQLDAVSDACRDRWCVHETLIAPSPTQPTGFDLARDYGGLSATSPAEARYLADVSAVPLRGPHSAVRYRRLTPFADTVVHVVRIDLHSAAVTLQLTPAAERGRVIDQLSDHAASLAAINGSFFDKTFAPVGITVSDGDVWQDAYSPAESVFTCDASNHCSVHPQAPPAAPPQWHLAVAGIPALLKGGEDVSAAGCAKRSKFCTDLHPRTALGLSSDGGTLWLVTAEGRRPPVLGVSISQLIEVFRRLGATDAINLDGGGSSSLSLAGEQQMTRPLNEPELRKIANALLVRLKQR